MAWLGTERFRDRVIRSRVLGSHSVRSSFTAPDLGMAGWLVYRGCSWLSFAAESTSMSTQRPNKTLQRTAAPLVSRAAIDGLLATIAVHRALPAAVAEL